MQGYITSDCGAVSDVYMTHHYTNSTDETCAVTLGAGMDIDCGSFLDSFMGQAIADKVLDMSVVDTALQHLFAVQVCLRARMILCSLFDTAASVSWW